MTVVTWRGCVVFDDGGGSCSLWLLVAVCVRGGSVFVVVGRCGRSSLFAVLAVVVGCHVCWWWW